MLQHSSHLSLTLTFLLALFLKIPCSPSFALSIFLSSPPLSLSLPIFMIPPLRPFFAAVSLTSSFFIVHLLLGVTLAQNQCHCYLPQRKSMFRIHLESIQNIGRRFFSSSILLHIPLRISEHCLACVSLSFSLKYFSGELFGIHRMCFCVRSICVFQHSILGDIKNECKKNLWLDSNAFVSSQVEENSSKSSNMLLLKADTRGMDALSLFI